MRPGSFPKFGSRLAVNLSAPVLTGPVLVGSSFTVTPGSWSGSPTLTYTLYRDGVADGTQVGRTLAQINAYLQVSADVKPLLTVKEIPNGLTGSAVTSNSISYTPDPAESGLAFDYDPLIANMTKDGSDRVSAWNDGSALARHLGMAVTASQPTWFNNQINGTLPVVRTGPNRYMFASFTQLLPLDMYIVFRNNTIGASGSSDCLMDGTTGSVIVAFAESTAPTCFITSGTQLPCSPAYTIGNGIFEQANFQFNNASSVIRSSRVQRAAGNAGANSSTGGFTLGGLAGGSRISTSVDWARVRAYSSLRSTAQRNTLEAYLANHYNVA